MKYVNQYYYLTYTCYFRHSLFNLTPDYNGPIHKNLHQTNLLHRTHTQPHSDTWLDLHTSHYMCHLHNLLYNHMCCYMNIQLHSDTGDNYTVYLQILSIYLSSKQHKRMGRNRKSNKLSPYSQVIRKWKCLLSIYHKQISVIIIINTQIHIQAMDSPILQVYIYR